jgi:hypothetical protein
MEFAFHKPIPTSPYSASSGAPSTTATTGMAGASSPTSPQGPSGAVGGSGDKIPHISNPMLTRPLKLTPAGRPELLSSGAEVELLSEAGVAVYDYSATMLNNRGGKGRATIIWSNCHAILTNLRLIIIYNPASTAVTASSPSPTLASVYVPLASVQSSEDLATFFRPSARIRIRSRAGTHAIELKFNEGRSCCVSHCTVQWWLFSERTLLSYNICMYIYIYIYIYTCLIQGARRGISCSCIGRCSAGPGRACPGPGRWRPPLPPKTPTATAVAVVVVVVVLVVMVVVEVLVVVLARPSPPEAQVRPSIGDAY